MPNFIKIHKILLLPSLSQPLWFRLLAKPLSYLYENLIWLRRNLYEKGILKRHTLPGITISIGNIVAGGTGKTPVAIALAKLLKEKGYSPAILTRGYKSGLKNNEYCYLLNMQSVWPGKPKKITADEAFLQSSTLSNVPVIIGAQRVKAAKWFLSKHPANITHWLLDDGFQHLQLERTYNIVLLDSRCPFANGQVFPSGLLREPPSSLKYADTILWTRFESKKHIEVIDKTPLLDNLSQFHIPFQFVSPYFCKDNQQLLDAKKPFLFISGIAQPSRVVDELQKLGYKPKNLCFLSDHQIISSRQIMENIAGCDAVVTTTKDFFRDTTVFLNLSKPTYLTDVTAIIPNSLIQRICH